MCWIHSYFVFLSLIIVPYLFLCSALQELGWFTGRWALSPGEGGPFCNVCACVLHRVRASVYCSTVWVKVVAVSYSSVILAPLPQDRLPSLR